MKRSSGGQLREIESDFMKIMRGDLSTYFHIAFVLPLVIVTRLYLSQFSPFLSQTNIS